MSNYLSQDIQYNQPPTDTTFDLLSKVALAQQQKYDVNHQQIQSTLDAFGAMKVLRPEDQAYMAAKLNGITTQINAVGGNLASQSVSDSFMGKIKAAAQDPFILSAMENTAKYNNYQAEIAKLKEKNPEKYSDVNYQFGLNQAGFNDYITGKSDKMSSLVYSPYVDVTKTTLEKIKQLKDLRGEQTIKVPELDSVGQPTGRMITRSIKGLTQEEIFQSFPNLVTAEEQRQLTIDGWYKYKDRMPQAQVEFKAFTDTKEKAIDEAISQNQAIWDNTTNTMDKRNEAKQRIDNLKAQKSNLTSLKQSIDISNPTQLGGYLHQASFKDSLASMAQAKWSEEYGADEYFFDKANLDIKLQELEISKEKLAMEKAKAGIGITATDSISISEREGAIAGEIDPLTQLKGDYNDTYNQMVNLAKQAYNSDKTTPEMRNQFKAEMNRMGYNENGIVIDPSKAKNNSKASAFKVAFTESNMNYIHGDIAKQLSGLETKRTALANEFGTTERASLLDTFKKKPDEYTNDIVSKMSNLFTANPSGVGMSSKKADDFYYEVTGKHLTDSQKRDIQFELSSSVIGGFLSSRPIQQELKNAFLKNPEKLQIVSKYLGQIPSGTGFLSPDRALSSDLIIDARQTGNEALQQKVKDRRNVYFNTAEIATIKNEKVRENIVNMLPQSEQTSTFDPKNPISFYKNPDGSITIIQNKGYTTGKDQTALAPAKITVNKEDAPYKELMKYVDLTDKDRGLDASRTTINIKPYRPPYYLDEGDETVISQVDKQMANLPAKMMSGFVTPPFNYTTKSRTEDVYKAALKNRISEEKIENFTTELFQNINQFKVKLTPFDNTWAIEITKPNGERLIKGDTGIAQLEDDMVNLVENYPQTLISDWILRSIMKNPKSIDTLLK